MSTRTQGGGWPGIAVVGAGAVGCYFGGMLARAGAPVTLIGRRQHMEAVARDGLFIDGLRVRERVPNILTSTELRAAQESQIILFCVKTVDTESVAQALAPYLGPNSVILSLQNGVDNIDRMESAAKIDAIPTVVYVACEMVAPGHVKHSGRGDLVVGDLSRQTKRGIRRAMELEAIAAIFERAGVLCRVSQTIEVELWTKMAMNCAYNAVSALSQSKYGRIVEFQETRVVIQQLIEETVAVARAEGILISESTLIESALKLGEAMANATSSTAQDIQRGKPTEIDSLNGYVARRGAAHGVPTPVNHVLYALVKLLERPSA